MYTPTFSSIFSVFDSDDMHLSPNFSSCIVSIHEFMLNTRVSYAEMSNFCSDQGRTRVFGEAYVCMPQPEARGERRTGQKGPFL
jgi:hypothetical protein